MHYDAFAFAKNRDRPTILAKKQVNGVELGQRKGFSNVSNISSFLFLSVSRWSFFLYVRGFLNFSSSPYNIKLHRDNLFLGRFNEIEQALRVQWQRRHNEYFDDNHSSTRLHRTPRYLTLSSLLIECTTGIPFHSRHANCRADNK